VVDALREKSLTINRVLSIAPLVPALIGLYVFLMPIPNSVRLGGISSIYAYDVLRADALFLGFYSGAFMAVALIIRRPSMWTVVTGALCCWIPLLMSYAWTITEERDFGGLLAVVAIPTTYLSFNPWVDRLGAGLAVLAGLMLALYTLRSRRGTWLPLFRFVEGSVLAIIQLPLGVDLFDHHEVNQPVASQILSFPSNVEMLYGAGAFLVVAACLEIWLHLKRKS
jgi:hypothetical protein